MTIAVTGATGQLGQLIIEGLKKAGQDEIVALARSPEKIENTGVEARKADYDAPETLAPALAGVDTLMLVSGSEVGKRAVQHKNIIDAAKSAGVRRIVYTSLLHADTSPLVDLAAEHVKTEAMLKASGLVTTILRNGWYTENYTASVRPAVANGAFYGAAGEGKIAAAARADYARAAVAVLTGQGHDDEVYELAGSPAFTLADLAAEISRQTGKDIPYVNLSEADYAKALEGAGLPAPVAAIYAGFDAGAAQGALDGDGATLANLIGRPSTPLADSVKAALA
ncbi:SDR family oxidoreductase [Paracoccus sp. 11-3]|uniref:SDR family oxidoreductase n=1 Tax=Paracoccus amoyensis TaxID=2760093 RepID=A0A926G913_9RHOB|nr:SDR family oxidoreductase [Paracoccus amoyensis]MBC9245526.1 SDR family oxidoreductase [Paracoccus amoyensis]